MHDVIIVGGGPAGLTAGIYLARAGLKVKILEKESIGGQIASSPLVENYPGFKAISGSELADNLYEQVVSLGVDIEIEEVVKVLPNKVITIDNEYDCKAIVLAVGAKYRKLGLDNEDKLIGRGIHFCVSCDGAFYKDKVVAVIGGGNTAVTNAIYLSNICKKVYLILIEKEMICEVALQNKIKNLSNVEILYESSVSKFNGEDELESIIVNGNELKVDGLFESIGMIPNTSFECDLVLDNGYYDSSDTKTNIEGIFVAGDCRSKKVRQLTTAVNDGTIAAINVIDYLKH